jgi:hypothetical protein
MLLVTRLAERLDGNTTNGGRITFVIRCCWWPRLGCNGLAGNTNNGARMLLVTPAWLKGLTGTPPTGQQKSRDELTAFCICML